MLAVGTKKGLFLGWSDDRDDWEWEGPHHSMAAVAAVAIDTRRSPARLLVGGRNEHWGPAVFTSDDRGQVVVGGTWRFASPSPPTPAPTSSRSGSCSQVLRAGRTRSGRGSSRRRCSAPTTAADLHPEPGAVGPPASARLASRGRGPVPAHRAAAPRRRRAASWWRCRRAVST